MRGNRVRIKSPFYKFVLYILRPVFQFLYFLKIKNRHFIPLDRNFILCSNHNSFKDPIFLGFTSKKPLCFMAKSELFKNKFLSWLFYSLGAFPVNRDSHNLDAINLAEGVLNSSKNLAIFIEGKRSKDGKLLKPKTGVAMIAYNTSTPIIPVSITTKSGRIPKIFNNVTINIGAPIEPKDLNIKEGKISEFRSASRFIMDKIAKLRAEDVIVDG